MQLHDLQISLGCDRGAETRKDEQPPRILEPTRGLEKPSAKPALGQAGQVCVEELSKEADGRIACNGIRRCGGPVWHVRRHQQLSRPGPKRFQIWGFELVWTKGRQRFLSRAVPGLAPIGRPPWSFSLNGLPERPAARSAYVLEIWILFRDHLGPFGPGKLVQLISHGGGDGGGAVDGGIQDRGPAKLASKLA
jgi:hypothetical protein